MPPIDAPAPTVRRALVLGLTGAWGEAIARALLEDGYRVRALVRSIDRARPVAERLPGPVELVEGDVHDAAALPGASRGVNVVAHGVNVPYPRWAAEAETIAHRVADAAAQVGATILFPGNVYNYAPSVGITPQTAPAPPTELGRIRVRVEEILTGATQRGARLIVLRGGDFFGGGSRTSWMAHVLERAIDGGAIRMPSDDDVPHAWCYLPDFACAHVALLNRANRLPQAAVFHFAGHVLTGRQLVEALRDALDDRSRPARRVPWPLLAVMGLFNAELRLVHRMRYLWQQPVLLDESALRTVLGVVPRTDLRGAVCDEVARLRSAPMGATARAAA